MAASDPLEVPDGVPADALDDLYARPLKEFTPARNELAKQLRAEGDREAAEWVKGLSKPTAAAWAVNQLARLEPQAFADLGDAGAELATLQEKLMKGTADRGRLRAAQQREREVIDHLREKAKGLSPSAAEKVRETLHAAGVDERTRELAAAGRLPREQVAVGLGPMVTGSRSVSGGTAKKTSAKRRGPGAALVKKLDRAREQQRERERKLKEATATAERARRDLSQAERRAQRAADAMEMAVAANADAGARVAELEAELAEAEA